MPFDSQPQFRLKLLQKRLFRSAGHTNDMKFGSTVELFQTCLQIQHAVKTIVCKHRRIFLRQYSILPLCADCTQIVHSLPCGNGLKKPQHVRRDVHACKFPAQFRQHKCIVAPARPDLQNGIRVLIRQNGSHGCSDRPGIFVWAILRFLFKITVPECSLFFIVAATCAAAAVQLMESPFPQGLHISQIHSVVHLSHAPPTLCSGRITSPCSV